MKKLLNRIALLFTFVLLTISAYGIDNVWLGGPGADWGTDGNWSLSHTPTHEEVAVFNGTSAGTCRILDDVIIRGIRMENTFNYTLLQGGGTCHNQTDPNLIVDIHIGPNGFFISGGEFIGGRGEIICTGEFDTDGGVYESCGSSVTEAEYISGLPWELYVNAESSYSTLKEKLDGAYTVVTDDYLRFMFRDEYKPNEISLSQMVYDYKRNEFGLPLSKTGFNLYQIDVSSLIAGVYYTLEVLDESGKKFQLRFKKEQ